MTKKKKKPWPLQLWKPRSLMICHWQTGDIVVQSESKALSIGGLQYKSLYEFKSPRTRSANVQRQKKMDVSPQAETEFTHCLSFCFIQVLNGLDDAYLHWWGCFSLLSLLIQKIISFGDNFTDTQRNNVLSAIWAFLAKSRWHIKLTITQCGICILKTTEYHWKKKLILK